MTWKSQTAGDVKGTLTMADAVRDNPAKSRFELEIDGHIAFINYKQAPGRIVLLHTEVPPELAGRGIGSAIAKGTFELLRAKGIKAELRCEFLQAYLKKHLDYNDVMLPIDPID